MERKELVDYLINSDLLKKWHWFRWHFRFLEIDIMHPLVESFIDACINCEKKVTGFAKKMSDRLIAINGKEKFEPHYEQLIQLLAELHVMQRLLTFEWPPGTEFLWEPTAGNCKKNPELQIRNSEVSIGFEVKSPSLLKHILERSKNSLQLPARLPQGTIESFKKMHEGITFPRDNPIKDFLDSSNKKFRGFKETDKKFISILIIVWDDNVYEPVSSLLSPNAGLLTENSFYLKEGRPEKFENVDGIVLIRHLHQLYRATRDEPFFDQCRYALDYGRDDDFPPKVIIENPHSKVEIPKIVYKVLQLKSYSPLIGAEYNPLDFTFWV